MSCFPQFRCNSFAFRTLVLLCLLLDLDTFDGVDTFGVFPLFLKIVADIIVPKLSIIFLYSNPSGIVSLVTPVVWGDCLTPVVWGIRIQPTFALVRVVKGD